MKAALLTALLLILSQAAAGQSEASYQKRYCDGKREHVLPDRTRVDCLTATHAIEYDFSHKWAEAIGQALHYSVMTGKKAGVVLILREPSDEKHWKTLVRIIEERSLEIDAWRLKDY